ncbi:MULTISPECIES: hypothetical protein [unclassified Streptomyces]
MTRPPRRGDAGTYDGEDGRRLTRIDDRLATSPTGLRAAGA